MLSYGLKQKEIHNIIFHVNTTQYIYSCFILLNIIIIIKLKVENHTSRKNFGRKNSNISDLWSEKVKNFRHPGQNSRLLGAIFQNFSNSKFSLLSQFTPCKIVKFIETNEHVSFCSWYRASKAQPFNDALEIHFIECERFSNEIEICKNLYFHYILRGKMQQQIHILHHCNYYVASLIISSSVFFLLITCTHKLNKMKVA